MGGSPTWRVTNSSRETATDSSSACSQPTIVGTGGLQCEVRAAEIRRLGTSTTLYKQRVQGGTTLLLRRDEAAESQKGLAKDSLPHSPAPVDAKSEDAD